jgi:hypothetical protein
MANFEPWPSDDTENGDCMYFDVASQMFYSSVCNNAEIVCSVCQQDLERLVYSLLWEGEEDIGRKSLLETSYILMNDESGKFLLSGPNVIKHFVSANYEFLREARVIYPGKTFHPSLTF